MAVSYRWRPDSIDNADDLVTEQEDGVTRIARERSLTCPNCGFSEPPNLRRRTRLGRTWAVVLTKLGQLLGQAYDWSEEVVAIGAQVTVEPRESPPP